MLHKKEMCPRLPSRESHQMLADGSKTPDMKDIKAKVIMTPDPIGAFI